MTAIDMQSDNESADTVGVSVLRRIRTDIIYGRLRPGERLRLEKLKNNYGVSVSTLREMLNRLTTEEFVVAEGQRGFEVASATVTNFVELGELRILLENNALENSLSRGDLDWEARVVAAHHRLSSVEKQLLGNDDPDLVAKWVGYDFAFHHAIIDACGSATLLQLHHTIFDRFMRYHMLAGSFRGQGVFDDHKMIFELVMNRDAKGAAEVLAKHVRAGMEHIVSTNAIARIQPAK